MCGAHLQLQLPAAARTLDLVEAEAVVELLARHGEIWRDMGRYGEVWRGMGRYWEVWGGGSRARGKQAWVWA